MANRIKIEREARSYLAKGDWNKAISTYRSLLDMVGDDPNVYNLLGDVYMRMGDTSEAFKEYTTAVDLYAKEGLFENAIAVYNKVLRMGKERKEIYFRMAELYAQLGLANESLDALETYLSKKPEQEELKADVQRYRKIITLISGSKSLFPRIKDIYLSFGYKDKVLDEILELEETKKEEKIPEIEKEEVSEVQIPESPTPEQVSEMPSPHPLTPPSSEESSFLFDIIAHIKKELQKQPQEEKDHYKLGVVYKEMKLLPTAIEEFQLATRSSNKTFESLRELGTSFVETGEYDLAVSAFDRALKEENHSQHDYTEVHYELGKVCQISGKIREAIKEFQETRVYDVNYKDVSERLKKLREMER